MNKLASHLRPITAADLEEGRRMYLRYRESDQNRFAYRCWTEWLDCFGTRMLDALADQPAATETGPTCSCRHMPFGTTTCDDCQHSLGCAVHMAHRKAEQAPRGATTVMFDGSEVMGTPVRAPQGALDGPCSDYCDHAPGCPKFNRTDER